MNVQGHQRVLSQDGEWRRTEAGEVPWQRPVALGHTREVYHCGIQAVLVSTKAVVTQLSLSQRVQRNCGYFAS